MPRWAWRFTRAAWICRSWRRWEPDVYSIRPVTLNDVEIIAGHRHRMFLDMGKYDPQKLELMTDAYRPWLESKMAAGEYLGWLAMAADRSVAAGLGLWLVGLASAALGGGVA